MEDTDKWIEEVFNSMRNSQRAKPSPNLFDKIEAQIYGSEAKIIYLKQWKKYAAVACLLIYINIAAILYYNYNLSDDTPIQSMAESNEEPLLLSYQIYDTWNK